MKSLLDAHFHMKSCSLVVNKFTNQNDIDNDLFPVNNDLTACFSKVLRNEIFFG